jgi:hypothetical protein
MHDLVGAELVEGIALRLKWSNDRRELVRETVANHMQENSPIREADNASKSNLDKLSSTSQKGTDNERTT